MKNTINEIAGFSDLKDILDRAVLFNANNETFSNIIFYLKNGRELISCPYKVRDTKNDSLYYCLDWDYNSRRQSDTLSIIPLSEITYLSIPNFEAAAFIKNKETLSPIGGLQLSRLIEKTSADLSNIIGQKIQIKAAETGSDNESGNLNKVLNLLTDVFKAVALDDFSKKSVSEKINTIKLKGGTGLLIALEEKTLVIQFDTNDNQANFKLKNTLIEGIEKIF